jgi:hypothetical protein
VGLKDFQIGKEEMELFADDMMLYIEKFYQRPYEN